MHKCACKTILDARKSVYANIKFVKPWPLTFHTLGKCCRLCGLLSMSRRVNKPAKNIKCVCIIPQNTRGLKSDEKVQELCTTIKSRNIFAVYLQESWRTGIIVLEYENCIIFSSRLKMKPFQELLFWTRSWDSP